MRETGNTLPYGAGRGSHSEMRGPYPYTEGTPKNAEKKATLRGQGPENKPAQPPRKEAYAPDEFIHATPKKMVIDHFDRHAKEIIAKVGAEKAAAMKQNCADAFTIIEGYAGRGNLEAIKKMGDELHQYILNGYRGSGELAEIGFILKSVTSEGELRKQLALGLWVECRRKIGKLENK